MDVSYATLSQAMPYLEEAWNYTVTTLDMFERWQLVLFTCVFCYLVFCIYDFCEKELENGVWAYLKKKMFIVFKRIPFVQGQIMKELKKTNDSIKDDFIKANKGQAFIKRLPEKGMTQIEVLRLTDDYLKLGSDLPWKEGALSGCVYGADEDLEKLTTQVYSRFAWSNPMHADVFPDVRKMEAEVVRWACTLLNGDENTCGTMSSGGTESIMLACRAYRERARARGIHKPEIVCPVTAHAAFDKAADFFAMKIHHVPVDPKTKKVSAKVMHSYINSNTCMLVGSAPHFPHGAIDPIEDIAKLAVKYDIPMHVDACLGGFLIVFMRDAGFSLPAFDYSVPGVTSISCDTHKYGYTPKGSSVITYRNEDYRRYQYFSAVEWPGGIYVSPTFAGSRAGSLIAMTWATLAHIGHEGYVNITREIIKAARYIADEIRKIPELELMCEPEVSVVAFTSTHFNILRLLDDMAVRGWHLNALQNPTGLHIAVTKLHTKPGVAQRFAKDIKECVRDIMTRDDRKLGRLAAIYCSTQSVPDKSLIADAAYLYLDACYSTSTESFSSVSSAAKGSKRKANGKEKLKNGVKPE